MGTLILWATVSIFFSFLCSILEAVLLSVTPTFINVKKQEGKEYAETLESLKKDVDQPLIAILTLNSSKIWNLESKVIYIDIMNNSIINYLCII